MNGGGRTAGGTDWRFEAFHTPAGEYPASFDAFDAVVLTGSRHDAFGEAPWLEELRARVRGLMDARKPVVGICFGHQLIGYAYGSAVRINPRGWEVGTVEVELTLEPVAGGTRLTVAQSGFADDQPQNYAGARYGWTHFLDRLATHLEA